MIPKTTTLAVIFAVITSASVRADERGTAILKEAYKKLHAAKTMTCEVKTDVLVPTAPGGKIAWTGKVMLMKPNFAKIEFTGAGAQSFFADGKDYYLTQVGRSAKLRLPAEPDELQGVWEGEIDAFFGGEKLLAKLTATYKGTEKLGEVECDLVEADYPEPPRKATYAIARADSRIVRAEIVLPSPMGDAKQTNVLSNQKLNVAKTAADFEYKGPAPQANAAEANLLAVGADAPDFNLPTFDTGRVVLSEAVKSKKAVLVNFWFYS